MGALDYIELTLGTLLSPFKNHYSKTLHQHPILTPHSTPTLTVTSPAYSTPTHPDTFQDARGNTFLIHPLRAEHTKFGANELVPLSWSAPPSLRPQIKQWVFIIEDPDAPVPFPVPHAIFYDIPAGKIDLGLEDIELKQGWKVTDVPKVLEGGLKSGKTMMGAVHDGPRPPFGHGRHLYLYQVLALGEEVEWERWETGKGVGVKEICEAVEGRVVGWGMWVGGVERRWKS